MPPCAAIPDIMQLMTANAAIRDAADVLEFCMEAVTQVLYDLPDLVHVAVASVGYRPNGKVAIFYQQIWTDLRCCKKYLELMIDPSIGQVTSTTSTIWQSKLFKYYYSSI